MSNVNFHVFSLITVSTQRLGMLCRSKKVAAVQHIYCVDEGVRDWGGDTGLFKKSYDVESLFFGSVDAAHILSKLQHSPHSSCWMHDSVQYTLCTWLILC